MLILIDSSVWIDYFRSGARSGFLDRFIDENIVATNEIILTELIPFLKHSNQTQVINMLNQVTRLRLVLDWDTLREFQLCCLKHGVNGIGIPDLIIAQNALHHMCPVYSIDTHFLHLSQVLGVELVANSCSK